MQTVAPAAFFAATLRFYAKINNRPAKNGSVDPAQVKEGLSEQFIKTAEHFTTRGAEMIKADEDRKKFLNVQLIPHPDVVLSGQPLDALQTTIAESQRQNKLSDFLKQANPDKMLVEKLRKCNPADTARMAHLSTREIPIQPKNRMDIPPDQKITYTPLAFLDRINPNNADGLSKYQAGKVIKLIMGLDQDIGFQTCPCGQQFTKDGAHQLCCRQHAAKGWNRGHDLVVEAIKKETDRLGIQGTTNKQTLSNKYSHAADGKVADALIKSQGKIQIVDQVPRHKNNHEDFLFDVTIDAMVQTDGKWKGRVNPGNGEWEDTVLPAAENEKYRKHEEAYANLSLGFLAFSLSCFCVFGNDLIRYLWVLARLETKAHEDLRATQQLIPFTIQETGQLRARCMAASMARIGHAAAKATAMRISGTPCLPILHPPPRRDTHWAMPGPLDVQHLPCPHLAYS